MVKLLKNKYLYIGLIIASIFILSIVLILSANTTQREVSATISNEMITSSTLYTSIDDKEENLAKGSLNAKDQLVCYSPDGHLALYFDSELCIFKLENKDTGYIYASALDDINDDEATEYYCGFLSSSFSIYYYQYMQSKDQWDLNTVKAWLTKATKHKAREKENLPEETRDKVELKIADDTEYSYSMIDHGVKVSIKFAFAKELSTDKGFNLGIGITAYVTLDNDGLHVKIPREEIVEENDRYRLAGVMVMPLMGAPYSKDTKGYILIPDGAGALIRYGSVIGDAVTQQNYNNYGMDFGNVTQGSVDVGGGDRYKSVTAPLYGYVNGIDQDGILAILEDGKTLSTLTVSPYGAFNIKKDFAFATFRTRFTYYLYGVSINLIDSLFNDDISMYYKVLSNENANYVGMANAYRDYLLDNEMLEKTSSGEYRNQIDLFLSDVETSMFGYSSVKMTSIREAKAILNELIDAGIDPLVILKGWSKNGFSGATPYKLKYNTSVGSKAAFKKFIADYSSRGVDVYLHDNYLAYYSRSTLTSGKVAKSLLRLRITLNDSSQDLFTSYSYVEPTAALDLAKKLVKKGDSALGLEGLALDGISHTLFSYYKNNTNYSRYDCYKVYDELVSLISDKYNLALYKPNNYLWKYLDAYLEMPIYANSYHLYSDNVPFIPYVLKGYVDYFANYLNFNSLGKLGYLRLLDYGCYPAFLLSNESSYKLKYAGSNSYYTTKYADWKDTIIEFNNTYKAGYETSLSSTVYSREMLESGFVKIIYKNIDNGSFNTILINYNNEAKTYNNNSVAPLSYLVIGGKA